MSTIALQKYAFFTKLQNFILNIMREKEKKNSVFITQGDSWELVATLRLVVGHWSFDI